ncbi:hypothetical protein ACFVJS_25220 [Nocardioides sp. NPDC057772]|uniref:DUF7660 family protein n=1 Tax=Nocardioides sp. NPDC057772 TaxID=3346245 RepID=UPI003672D1F1
MKSSATNFETVEQMHYVCFHYEFEHGDIDVDEECNAGGCPSASIGGGRDAVVATARELAMESASGAPWRNAELHEYLEAFASWLDDSGGIYAENGDMRVVGNGWEVVRHGLRTATGYE